jgi:acyl-CoA synthetase (AMP-forming)/AMP-acid ligase II/acyl carrier protein
VPSLLGPVLEEPALRACPELRSVFCGGEGMGRDLHDRFFAALPGRVLAHFYGPTEAAISCLYHDCAPPGRAHDCAPLGRAHDGVPNVRVRDGEDGADAWEERPRPVPIGLPIANVDVHVLDGTLHPVPEGVPGEIYVGGVALARGYLGRADLTAERFIPDPAGARAGGRLYRTGDVAIRRENGALTFLGRADRQIKIRGHRIEPAEIESALARAPGVRSAVVVLARPHVPARGDVDGRRLVAYVECPGEAPEEGELRAFLRRSLPEPMVPSAFVVLQALPLGPNGKVDHSALPEPGRASRPSRVAPRTPTERAIASIWETLLRREGVGAEDDFFELGGDSLLATQVVSRLRAAFEVELPLRRFFEGSTVAALAEKVEDLLVEKLEAMPEEEADRRVTGGAAGPGERG